MSFLLRSQDQFFFGFFILGPLVLLALLALIGIVSIVQERKMKKHAPDLLKLRDGLQPAYQKLERVRASGLPADAATREYNLAHFHFKEGKVAIESGRYEEARERATVGLERLEACNTELGKF